MNIAIVTIIGNFNYGNRLQNYALQQVLNEMNHEVTTLAIDGETIFKRLIMQFFVRKNGKIILKPYGDIVREKKFANFTKKYIKTKVLHNNERKFPTCLNEKYDYFVVGSDQVWNPYYWWDIEESEFHNYLLRFCSPLKKISYAASFGIKDLPDYWKEKFSEELKSFKAISVREEQGVNIIKRICDRSVEVVLDPTMLLDATQWREFQTSPVIRLKEKYILCFFLGNQSEEMKDYVKQIAKQYELELIDLMDMQSIEAYVSDPSEFLYFIDNAELVLTDSFHATVFSIIFHTTFITFQRNQTGQPDMNSRIMTLLDKFGLNSRAGYIDIENVFKCDFSNVDEKLGVARKKSKGFLKEALNYE